MRAVLIGGSGFIGSHLASRLVAAGYEVVVYDERKPALGVLSRQAGVQYVAGDAFSPEPTGLPELLRGARLVYHLAWRHLPAASNQAMAQDIQTNLIGSLNLLRLCCEVGVGRVVFFSSGGSVYGPAQSLPITEDHPTEPLSSHAVNKLAVEKYLAILARLYNLDYVILRPGNPFGPYQNPEGGQGVIAAFLARAAVRQPLAVWGDGSTVRDYFYVGDLARAAVMAGETMHSRTVYNIGSGVGRSLHEVISAISRLVGHELEVHWLPGRPTDVPINVLDASKARRLLGWAPEIPFEEGLRLTWDYYRRACGEILATDGVGRR